MVRVLYALCPVALLSVYLFGWRTLSVLLVTLVFAFLTEWVMVSTRNGKVSAACFVTSALFALSLPPAIPLWIAAVGAVAAILFAKEAFGGFGKNVFNPAIVGRAFVYVCFPAEMTGLFTPVFRGWPGGFSHWSFLSSGGPADAVSAATPMLVRRVSGNEAFLKDLFLGGISGSMGEVSALLILLCGIYLIATRTAKWQLMVSTLAGAAFLNILLRQGFGLEAVPPLAFTLFSGALFYAAVFMVTDPISAPRDRLSVWIYGAFIGMMVVLFRFKSAFTGGVAFAVLLGNILGPSLDLWIGRLRARGAR